MGKHRNHFRWLVWIGIIACLLWSGEARASQPPGTARQGEEIVYEGVGHVVWEGTQGSLTVNTAGGPDQMDYYPYHCEFDWNVVLTLHPDGTATMSSTRQDYHPDKGQCVLRDGTFEGDIAVGTYSRNPNQLLFSSVLWVDYLLPIGANEAYGFTSEGVGSLTDTTAEGYISWILPVNDYKIWSNWRLTFHLYTEGGDEIPTETPEVAGASCSPTVRGLSPQKPGDVIAPGATYHDETGNEVGDVQEYWYFNGVETTSIVWDGKKVTVELQWSCPNKFGDSRSYTIPAYQGAAPVPPEGQPPAEPGNQPPSFPGNLTPQDIATGVGAILIGLGGIIGIGGAIGVGGAIIGAPPAGPSATPNPPAAQPPPPGSPGAPGGEPPPEASPGAGAPKSFVDNPLWDLVKINTSAASTIAGTMSDLLKFPDSADKIQKMRDALDAWRRNPTPANGDIYRKTLDNSFKGKYPGIGKVSDSLGNLSKGVDVIDAIGAGMKKAAEKGLGGDDKNMIIIGEVGKEIIKKGLTWTITKNPVVGIADAVVGGVSQWVRGKDNRIDLGAGVDKVAGGVFNVYDKTTSGLGRLWEKGLTDAAKSNTKSALESARRLINDQVSRGKISDTTGRSRLRILEKMITGDK